MEKSFEEKIAAGQAILDTAINPNPVTFRSIKDVLGFDWTNLRINPEQPYCYFSQLIGVDQNIPAEYLPFLVKAALKCSKIARDEVILQVSIINHEVGWVKKLEYLRSLPGVAITQVKRNSGGNHYYTAYSCLVPGPKYVTLDDAPLYHKDRV
jgi:hypothetical protein